MNGQWQPSETAPNDEALLVWADHSFVVGHYNTALKRWIAYDERGLRNVTHWMPLPPRPEPTNPVANGSRQSAEERALLEPFRTFDV